jgi:hypothetical protein
MTIDPLIMLVVDILGKYAIDKGASLLKEAGQSAVKVAAKLFEQVMSRLKADPAEAKNAERFEKNPEAFQPALAAALAEKVKNDPEFAAQLASLLKEYERARNTGSPSIKVGSGAVALQEGVAAGEGGMAISGNVEGGITLNNTRSRLPSEGDDP